MIYYNIIILWDHRCICGPSLTETSLRGAYLYIKYNHSILSMNVGGKKKQKIEAVLKT
jgi:hypothetical protein